MSKINGIALKSDANNLGIFYSITALKRSKTYYSQTPLFRAPLFRDPPYFAVFEGQIFHPDLLQSY